MNDEFKDIWKYISDEVKKECSEATYNLWYSELNIVSITENYVFLTYPSTTKRDIFFTHHNIRLEKLLSAILGYSISTVVIALDRLSSESKEEQVQFCIDLVKTGKINSSVINNAHDEDLINTFSEFDLLSPDIMVEPDYYDSLDSKELIFDSKNPLKNYQKDYTFDNFVVGNSNRFTYAACESVASNPASSYNPLFIYGPSGLGKTHLLYAISNKVLSNNKNASIIYVKSEEFTNQLIDAISKGKTNAFRDKYRRCSVLLIDDVQFIAGKKGVQEEFFNTFNALYESGKQIILTSDRPPKDIEFLEERLKSRFEMGLMADIQPPDMELRIAILKKKAEDLGVTVSNDVLLFLADNIKSNIRQIEGAIKRLDAYSKLNNKEITVDLAKNTIGDILDIDDPSVTKDKIIRAIFDNYGITGAELIGKKRTGNLVNARFIAIYLLRTLTDMSLPEIGRVFQRDHTTVMNAYNKISDKLKSDSELEFELNNLIKEIKK